MDDGNIEAVDVLGVRVHLLTRRDLLRQVASVLRAGHRAQVMYANVHTLNTAYRDSELHRVLNRADIVYCDGEGVRSAARLLGRYLPQRMTGADWIYDLCDVCHDQEFSLYFLGGESGVAAQAAEKLQQRYPKLHIAGTHHGYYDHNGAENDQVIAQINTLQPHILLVGFGTPLQEKWIARNFERLDVPVIWAVGALVNFVAGRVPRAPRWMLHHGLEWLYRFLVEPRRMFARYIVGNPLFIFRVLKQRFLGP
jgi:N-acetylglucosaminyldiphosphoundecaprenol N-acetyl-beta-D-mannosaminyltransferase